MKTLKTFLLLGIIFVFPFQPSLAYEHSAPKNIILLIGDGMGFAQVQLTRLVYGHLNMEEFPYTGFLLTDSLSGEVTDSAAAGTAIATGVKTYNRMISMLNISKGYYVNLTTLLEIAQMLGKSTGLVTTTRITHATPAVFASHVPERDMEKEIAKQLILHNVTVLMGGGRKKFSRETLEFAKKLGYTIVYTRDELMNVSEVRKLLGLFADSHIPFVLDRKESDVGLLEMTKKAIEILEKNPNGFFLMIEGGRIDHACHLNDVASTVAETKEFDDVVGYILEYAKKRGDTLVIVLADHETGGLAVGLNYGRSIKINEIKNINASVEKIAREIIEKGDIEGVLRRYTGLTFTEEEINAIKEIRDPYKIANILGEIISKKLGVGFASHKHTGEPVPLLAYGPGAENFRGFMHHIDVAKTIAKLMLFGNKMLHAEISSRPSSVKGDITGDYKVTPEDAYVALTLFLGEKVDTRIEELIDMDKNGIIDLGDVFRIYSHS
ncbi:alkaline phosphatase IV precursor [Pyrococcus sp. NA2]|uniref:alkaline phosphatase n=1 Tax=Pyrococcus sp. (strain NA2) TaxID=342949 RepID=UPI000209AD49|nr:alkaline phosphatase [Pyrococcus sp. NA2]AEC51613.1 alkaline phosphatase IV precursor [Pyrococcus sp. NA2]